MNDTCPACLRRDNPPTRRTRRPTGQTTHHYRCRCGHTWTTDWAPDTGRDEDWDWPEAS